VKAVKKSLFQLTVCIPIVKNAEFVSLLRQTAYICPGKKYSNHPE
jgi:hypothetical protein